MRKKKKKNNVNPNDLVETTTDWSNITFPHIRYVAWPLKVMLMSSGVESDKYRVEMRYTGVSFNLTQGRKYEFRYSGYSPKRGIPYRAVLVTKDDNDNTIRMEEEPDKWVKPTP
jgi:alpha-glucuronidase